MSSPTDAGQDIYKEAGEVFDSIKKNYKLRKIKAVAESYLRRSDDPYIFNGRGHTFLHQAVLCEREDVLNFFLTRKGLNLQVRDALGNSLLHLSVGRLESDGITRYLIKKGIDVNSPNNVGFRPLHIAAEKGSYALVTLLIGVGGVPYAHAHDDVPFRGTPLYRNICGTYNRNIVEYLYDRVEGDDRRQEYVNVGSFDYSPLTASIAHERFDTFVWLLKHGAHPHYDAERDQNPLHLLCEKGDKAFPYVEMLVIDYGVDVNHTVMGFYAIEHAASQLSPNIVGFLFPRMERPDRYAQFGSWSVDVVNTFIASAEFMEMVRSSYRSKLVELVEHARRSFVLDDGPEGLE